MAFQLLPHQQEVLERLSFGKILWGPVGSGKSITALSYYMQKDMIGDIYVITTAKKRDSLEWERDAAKLGIGKTKDSTVAGILHIDSWNNIAKYTNVENAFFIFDEQRLIGNGAWVKSFYKIAAKNPWMILSATPGDTWMDYVPVFVANGYYKNITQFKREHVVYRAFARYPQIDRYLNVEKLQHLKEEVLVEMKYLSASIRKYENVRVDYDVEKFNRVLKDRWNIYRDQPIENVSQLFSVLRRVVYSDPSRLDALRKLMDVHPRLIVFYNFNYELHILRQIEDTWSDLVTVAEWNGQNHDPIPETDNWVYLVQYTAGAEGWNCTSTDAMVFYSLPYSYKKFEQAQGRIDRLTGKFEELTYYSFVSSSMIDYAVRNALKVKKTFNEKRWAEAHLLDHIG